MKQTQEIWDKNRDEKIIYVYGNEWEGGNLSYHLKDRPKLRMEMENLGEEIILCGKTGESCLKYKRRF